jgi:hypothetical protein
MSNEMKNRFSQEALVSDILWEKIASKLYLSMK